MSLLRKVSSRRARLDQLRVEVAAHLPILPELSAQLRASTRNIEESVLQVCTNFQSIAGRVVDSVNRASQLLASSDHDGDARKRSFEELVEAARSTLETLLQRVVENAAVSEQVAARMEAVDEGVKQLTATLKEVNEIVRATKTLGVNARIEAIQVGEQAQGFALVATEIAAFSRRFARIAVTIQKVVDKVDRDVSSTTVLLRERAATDRDQMELSRAQIEVLLEDFQSTHAATRQFLADSAGHSDVLTGEISDAVVALQFQDRISQRVGHVIEALDSMKGALEKPLEGLGPEASKGVDRRKKEVLGRLRGAYTMAGERAVAAQGRGGAKDESVQPDDVELF